MLDGQTTLEPPAGSAPAIVLKTRAQSFILPLLDLS